MEVENTFSTPLKELTLHTQLILSTKATVWTSLHTWLTANCSMLSHASLVKYSCCSAAKWKHTSSCLFVLFNLTPSTTAAPPSCLAVLSYVSMWMASSCFQRTLLATGNGWVMSCRPHAHPTSFAGPDVHAQINTHSSHCSYIMTSHIPGLAVMKCEDSVTPRGS